MSLNKANYSDTEAPLDLNLSITNDIVSSKIYDKHDDFKFLNSNVSHFLMEIFLARLPMLLLTPFLFGLSVWVFIFDIKL